MTVDEAKLKSTLRSFKNWSRLLIFYCLPVNTFYYVFFSEYTISEPLQNRPLPELPETILQGRPPQRRVATNRNENIEEFPESFGDTSVTSSSTSVRTKYGISETEYHEDDTEIKFPAESQLSGTEEERAATRMCREIGQQVQWGNPNLPASNSSIQFQARTEQDPHSSSDTSDYSDSGTEENEMSHNDREDTEVRSHRSQTAPTGMSPRLEEVIEIRDICHDRTDGDQDGDENVEVLIMTDLVLKELRSCNVLPSKACRVHIQNDLDFTSTKQAVKQLPKFPALKAIFLHCGFKHSKKDIPKHLKEAINITDEKYQEAAIYISAILPCRGNKNRSKINEVNVTIEEACNETSAEFVNFTGTLTDEYGKLYSDTVSLNKKGARKFAEKMMKILHVNPTVRQHGNLVINSSGMERDLIVVGYDPRSGISDRFRDKS